MDIPFRILIVDDELLITGTLQTILQCYGYKATTFNSGYKALNSVRSDYFHVAIVDIGMPEMNGIELMTEIRRLSAHTRIILMTGYDKYHPLVKEAIAANPDELLYKPIDPEKLMGIVSYYQKIFEATYTPSLE